MGRLRQLWDCLSTWFIDFHFKNWGKIDKVLIVFRTLSIVGLFAYSIIDTLMYYSKSTEKSDALKFIHGSRYIGLEILTIVYASGVAAFGISVEIYILLLSAIVNCVLVVRSCGGSDEVNTAVIWIVKMTVLFFAAELCYRNFRELREYDEHFNSSARAMLKQALFFSATMLFLNSPGLRPVYYGTNRNLPRLCAYETSHCGIVNLYEPLFGYDNDKCLDDLTSYTAGREQLRILRDFILLHIFSYSVFNRNFFQIDFNAKYFLLRILLVFLFLAVATSVPIANVDPFFFINHCRLAYNIMECILLTILLGWMAFNLYNLRGQQPEERIETMDPSPTILPSN